MAIPTGSLISRGPILLLTEQEAADAISDLGRRFEQLTSRREPPRHAFGLFLGELSDLVERFAQSGQWGKIDDLLPVYKKIVEYFEGVEDPFWSITFLRRTTGLLTRTEEICLSFCLPKLLALLIGSALSVIKESS